MAAALDTRPRIPADAPAVGVIGAGAIARSAHLPAYRAWGIRVAAVASRSRDSARRLAADFDIPVVHDDVDALLADPGVGVVDLATGPEGRLDLVEAAVAAGKHVLAQKPFLTREHDLPRAERVLRAARERGVRIAVNQNARWTPAWRSATLLVRSGAIGDVVGVTHLHDKPLPPLAGTPFDDLPHMLLADYLVHWIDITRCWLEGTTVTSVSAADGRVPGQPADARNPWNADVSVRVSTGASGVIRLVGNARAASGGCPFWIHGTDGTIRGSVLLGSDAVSCERDGAITGYDLSGEWFPDGFAGAMGELLTSIVEGREPENSADNVLASVRLGLAAVESATAGGAPVRPAGLELTRASSQEIA